MRRCFCFVFLLLICLVLPNAQAAEEGTDILLSFTGDCTLGSEERTRWQPTSFDSYIEQHGYAYPFAKVQSVLAQDDVTVINLENVFYQFKSNQAQKTYTFRGPPEFAQILTEGSVELSYLGNNHTNDYGFRAFAARCARWRRAATTGLPPPTTASRPGFMRRTASGWALPAAT